MKRLLLCILIFAQCDLVYKDIPSSFNIEVSDNSESRYHKKTKKVLLKLRNRFTKKVNDHVKKGGTVDIDGVITLIKNDLLKDLSDDVFNAYVTIKSDQKILYDQKMHIDKIISIKESHVNFKSEGTYGNFLRVQEDLKVNFTSKDSIYKNATLIKTIYSKEGLEIELDFLLTNTAFVKSNPSANRSL